ncbi:hypothetical protein T06_2759 [Trichinella sp. T6]|nr:hypothetical protein T06_2759 [Trichinella sp. T6]
MRRSRGNNNLNAAERLDAEAAGHNYSFRIGARLLLLACLVGWLVGIAWFAGSGQQPRQVAYVQISNPDQKIFGSEFIFEPTRASLRHNVSQPCDAAYMLTGLPAYLLACLLACLFTAAPVTRQSITAIKLCESTLVLASGERQNFPLVPTLIPASTHCRRYLVTKDWSAVWTFDVVLFYLLPPTIYELSLHPERLSSPSIQTVQQSPAKMREASPWLSRAMELRLDGDQLRPWWTHLFSIKVTGLQSGARPNFDGCAGWRSPTPANERFHGPSAPPTSGQSRTNIRAIFVQHAAFLMALLLLLSSSSE